MKRKMIGITLTLLLVVLTAIALITVKRQPIHRIRNFSSCVAAGYTVLYTYPSQCKTPNGRVFTQQFDNEKRRPKELPKERSWEEAKALIRTCQVKATALPKNGALLMLLQDDSNITIDTYNPEEFQLVKQEAKQRCHDEVATVQE